MFLFTEYLFPCQIDLLGNCDPVTPHGVMNSGHGFICMLAAKSVTNTLLKQWLLVLGLTPPPTPIEITFDTLDFHSLKCTWMCSFGNDMQIFLTSMSYWMFDDAVVTCHAANFGYASINLTPSHDDVTTAFSALTVFFRIFPLTNSH